MGKGLHSEVKPLTPFIMMTFSFAETLQLAVWMINGILPGLLIPIGLVIGAWIILLIGARVQKIW